MKTLISQPHSLLKRYEDIRAFTLELCRPLEVEDYVIQSMPDASPAKWHLAHTTWFFENFILAGLKKNYRIYNHDYNYLFNSYYNAMGPRHCRARRGLLSRPTVKEILDYRGYIDGQMREFLNDTNENITECVPLIETGLHHEQQHQELLLTDIKHVFFCNPLFPAYKHSPAPDNNPADIDSWQWHRFEEGIYEAGHTDDGFAYDNETPAHKVYLGEFFIASRLITNQEYLEFMRDGGYERTELWLSDGWTVVNAERWKAPLYWERNDGEWFSFTLEGLKEINPREPVYHVSYYEADAFARWAGRRLLTEFEWEAAARTVPAEGNFIENDRFHPIPAENEGLRQMYGDVWEWTSSAYSPYPGYRPAKGALGEYNGKFMCNQMVLRGGSFATSQSHIRPTYRNFFAPQSRWQFSGIRLGQ